MMKTMCPPGYHHSGFMAADAVGLMIYVIYIELAKSIIYIYIYIYIYVYIYINIYENITGYKSRSEY